MKIREHLRPRVLYIINLPWDWVRQRPQYLADAVTANCSAMLVLSPYIFRRRRELRSGGRSPSTSYRSYVHVPFRHRSRTLEALDHWWMSTQLLWWLSMWRPDVVWISYADLVQYLPQDIGRAALVYDCMDDFAMFPVFSEREAEQFRSSEATLVTRSSTVFVSSEHLLNTLGKRYGMNRVPVLLRNAFGGPVLPSQERRVHREGDSARIGYIGNMETLDQEAIRATLDQLPALSYDLFGPAETVPDLCRCPRVVWHGVAAHDKLACVVEQDDCLIVPYLITERVLAADSMKLYDYVNIGKPIVSVWYEEIERFRPFVEFYKTPDELVSVLKRLMAAGFQRKYTEEQRLAFLAENTWEKRAEIVDKVLRRVMQADVSKGGPSV
jgi:teichuronic acid biosynthesis glycosyltransferase TuaH